MTKKKIRLLAVLLVCLLGVSGCGKQSNTESTSDSESGQSSTEVSDAESSTEAVPENSTEESILEETTEPEPTTEAVPGYQKHAWFTDGTLAIHQLKLGEDVTSVTVRPYGEKLLIIAEEASDEMIMDPFLMPSPLRFYLYDPETGLLSESVTYKWDEVWPYDVTVTSEGMIVACDSMRTTLYWLDENLQLVESQDISKVTIDGEETEASYCYFTADMKQGYFTVENTIYLADFSDGSTEVVYTWEGMAFVDILEVNNEAGLICMYGGSYDGSVGEQAWLSLKTGKFIFTFTEGVWLEGNDEQYCGYIAQYREDNVTYWGIAGTWDNMEGGSLLWLQDGWQMLLAGIDAVGQHLIAYDFVEYQLHGYDVVGDGLFVTKDYSAFPEVTELVDYGGMFEIDTDEQQHCFGIETLTLDDSFYIGFWDYMQEEPLEEDASDFGESWLDKIWKETEASEESTEDVPTLEWSDEMQAVRDQADVLEAQYGVEILLGSEVLDLSMDGYELGVLEDATILADALLQLESALSVYPEGFFRQLRSTNVSEGLYIGLCGGMYGEDAFSLSVAAGLTTCVGNEHQMAVDCSTGFYESVFYHEMSHVIDNHIYNLYYEEEEDTFSEERWNSYNPEGFEYTYSYTSYEQGMDSAFTLGGYNEGLHDFSQVCVVDFYGKTYPTEDRATIMEHAMFYGTVEYVMTAPLVQQKLDYMCRYIRKHFDTTGWPEVTPWEAARMM